MMVGSSQHLTNGNSSDEHDSDDEDEDDEDDDDDEDGDDDEDDDEDDDDLEELDEDDDDEDDDEDGEGRERDRLHFVDGVDHGNGRAAFNFNVDGMTVSARMSPTRYTMLENVIFDSFCMYGFNTYGF